MNGRSYSIPSRLPMPAFDIGQHVGAVTALVVREEFMIPAWGDGRTGESVQRFGKHNGRPLGAGRRSLSGSVEEHTEERFALAARVPCPPS